MRKIFSASLGFALAVCALPAKAVEGGMTPYPKGFVNFMPGLVPPEQGWYMQNIFYYFHGNADASVRNGIVELGVDATLTADFVGATYVTDYRILGAQYGFGAAVGWAWLDLEARLGTPLGNFQRSANNNGFSDSLLVPVILGWHDGNFHSNFNLSVYMPTGAYDNGRLNVGKNVWAFFPQYALTWYDPQSGWDVSGATTYVTQTRNDATDYQSGDALQFDWSIGKHFGSWEVGLTGNLVQQIGADKGTGAQLGPFKAQSYGIGPAIRYVAQIGQSHVDMTAKYQHDLGGTNTFTGDVVTFTIAAAL